MKFNVSVILINYNSSDYTISCVESIVEETSQRLNYNIIVVDNNSDYSDYKKLEVLDRFPQVKTIRSKINLGFAGGNMLGLQLANSEYYFFLNNDCRLLNDCLSVLYKFCEDNLKVGVCTPQIFNENGEPQLSFGYFPTLSSKLFGTGLLRLFNKNKFPVKHIDYVKPIAVPVVTGASMFVRANAFHQVGGFDTVFFLYCEEEDLAYRLSLAGYKTYLVPMAKNAHYVGKSTNRNLLIEKEYYISFLHYYRKHYGNFKTIIIQCYLVIKLLKRVFRSSENIYLAYFVACGAPLKSSLRYKQKISEI